MADRAERYRRQRAELVGRSGAPGPADRSALSDLTDRFLAEVMAEAALPGAALAAVGGYGRGELGPGSDLDLLLLVPPGSREVAAAAERIWYPAWDTGVPVDHAVRTPAQARQVAAEDLAAAVGLLDLRLIGGDGDLVDELRRTVAADWRAAARDRVPRLLAEAAARHDRHADVRYALEPDLKAGRGGLRDVAVLRAVRASWLAAASLEPVLQAEARLRDVRDALHHRRGPGRDRLVAQEQAVVAELLGWESRDRLLQEVHRAAGTISFAFDSAGHTVERAVRQRRGRFRGTRTQRVGLAADVVADDGEVVLARDARPAADPVLPLRTAAAAAQAGLRLAPATAERLTEAPTLSTPWPPAARDALLSLLGAGAGTVAVWEALDQVGLIQRLIPEWAAIADLPQRSPVHVYTVDRHSIEAAVRASALTRRVARPDLLLVAALLHDLGKGEPDAGDHCRAGVAPAVAVARRIGLEDADAVRVGRLVADHLLLAETATRRDLDDPATVAAVVARIGDAEHLGLLAALTEADALAAGPAAWTSWRASLVAELVRRAGARLAGDPPPPPRLPQLPAVCSDEPEVGVEPADDGHQVKVVAPDRPGLLAAGAGVLSLHRLAVRSARIVAADGVAVQEWQVVPEFGDPPSSDRLRADLRRALAGTLGLAARLADRESAYRQGVAAPSASVSVVAGASATATVLEVRAHDRIGLLHDTAAALTAAGVEVQAAVVSTLGADAVDVFYVTRGGSPLPDADAAAVATAVRRTLSDR